MFYKFEYSSKQEREKLLNSYSDKYLIEEQNIIEGNFLIFSDEPTEKEIIYTNVPQNN